MKCTNKIASLFFFFYLVSLFIPPLLIPRLLPNNGIISADAVLSYAGTIVGILGSVVIAAITIFHERDRQKQEKEIELTKRLESVRPALTIRMQREHKNLYKFTMLNHKESPALSIHIDDQFIFSVARINEKKEKTVTFDSNCKGLLLYPLTHTLDAEGYPSRLILYYMDVDHNCYEEEFAHEGNGRYTSLHHAIL